MRKRSGYQVKAHINRTANVLDGGTIRHQEHALLVQRTEGVLDGLAIGTWAISGINCHDVGTGGNAGASMTQRRRDVDALVPILPQADNRNLTATLNGGNVGKALGSEWRRRRQARRRETFEPWSRAYEAARPYRPERSRRACPSGTGSKDQRSCSTQPFSKQPSETPHLDVQTVARVPSYASLLFHVNLRHLRRPTW